MSAGICIKCGCTDERPCWCADGPRPCGWIDNQRDLCSRCAGLLLDGSIEPVDLAEACLVIRALRSITISALAEAAELEQLYQRMASETHGATAGGIWTPDL